MANNYTAIGQYLKDVQATSGMTQQAVAPRTEPAPTFASQPIVAQKRPIPPIPRPQQNELDMKRRELERLMKELQKRDQKTVPQEVTSPTEEQKAIQWLRQQGQTGVMTAEDIARAVKILRTQVAGPRRVRPTPRRILAPSVAQSIRRALLGQVGEQMRNLLLNR